MAIYDKTTIHSPAPGVLRIGIQHDKQTNCAFLTMEEYDSGETLAKIPLTKEAMGQLVHVFKCMRKIIYKEPILDIENDAT
jgi:hypothetical protein